METLDEGICASDSDLSSKFPASLLLDLHNVSTMADSYDYTCVCWKMDQIVRAKGTNFKFNTKQGYFFQLS